ncbi:MAG TPA: hypothetical protein VMD91_05050 [Candidatus Sulfotelmatobacter sp.]|nr:hypothetical protein [Candidatus Sulfotelmatobacter sp.]
MIALGPRSRTALAASGALCVAGAFVTSPLVARGGVAGDRFASAAFALTTPAPPRVLAVRPNRDPFAGPEGTPAPAPSAALALVPSLSAAVPVLPPNPGAGGAAPPDVAPPRLAAIVTGARPFALVDDPRGPRIVTVGDRLDGSSVAAIGATGVRLADGRRFSLDAGLGGGDRQ